MMSMDMDYKKLDDQSLIWLIARSQESALSEIYDRYSRLVYSLALNAVGDPATAEEITQDVFIRIWDHAGTYQAEKSKVITWIASITRYRSIDIIRRRKIRPEGQSVSWEIELSTIETNSINVEETVEISQERRRVRQAISILPEEQRQALAYAYFQGYTHREIAEVLGEPLGTVKTRIRLAMQKLRQFLEQEGHADV
jgi:RNA polymerase sigma-70 factor (ECF subfamily)